MINIKNAKQGKKMLEKQEYNMTYSVKHNKTIQYHSVKHITNNEI